jgi:hypothetical protein
MQEDQESEANLGYIVRPWLKNKKQNKNIFIYCEQDT